MTLPEMPTFDLDGQRALVTGAGRGIGLAAAVALARAGADVTLLARSSLEIEAAGTAIQKTGGIARIMVSDVLNTTATLNLLNEQAPFEILVNNAGTNRPAPMQDVTGADFDAVLNLNLRAAFFVAQAVAKGLIRAGKPGSLIHIGSQMGHVGGRNRSLYCASKWALEGMSKSFAIDLATYGIRSNTIAPTFVETALTAPYLSDQVFKKEVLGKIKLGRLATPEDIMGGILYLASQTSAMVTGTSLVIDGGWTAD